MKKIFFLLLAGTFILAACSKDDDDNNGPSAAVATSLKVGTWRVTSFVENGTDRTADFSSFVFTFSSTGSVAAVNSVLTANGTWATGTDDSKHKLILAFSSPALFDELSEDWEIVSQSSTQVSLRHVSGGSGETDLLVFQKN